MWAKSFGLRLALEGLSLRHELAPAPPTPPEETPATPLPQALKNALQQLRLAAKPSPLSFDLQTDVTMRNINLRVLTPGSATALEVRDFALSIAMPSLRAGVLTAQASFVPQTNHAEQASGTKLPPVAFQAKVTELASAQGELQPLRAMIDCTAAAPGLVASITGSVHKGLKADLRLQLAQLLTPLRPLLPPAMPTLTGALAFSATATMPKTAGAVEVAGAGDTLRLGLLVFADDVAATGGPLGAKSFGPLRLSLLQEAQVDLATGSVEIPGTLSLGSQGTLARATLAWTTLAWTGQIKGILESRPALALNAKDADLPLRPVLAAVRDFLPPGLSIGDAHLRMQQFAVRAQPVVEASGNPDLTVMLRGLSLGVQRCSLAQGKDVFALGSLLFNLDALDATLPAGAEGTLTATASAQATDLRKTGASALALRSATLAALRVNATGLRHDPAALFGVSGKLTVEKTATLTGLDFGGTLKADTLTKTVALSAAMPASKAISANLSELRVEIPALRATQKGKRPLEVPVLLLFKAPDIRLTQSTLQTPGHALPAPLIPAATGASLELSLGKALRTSAHFTLGGTGGRELATTGELSLDAGQLATLAGSLMPRTAKLSGVLGAGWNAAVVLPQAGAQTSASPSALQRLQEL